MENSVPNMTQPISGQDDIDVYGDYSAYYDYEEAKTYPEYQVSLVIWRYCPPVLLLLGGLGNVATIFVLRRMDWGQSTQHVFLTALAVVDLGLLYTGLLRKWIFFSFDYNLADAHVVICKVSSWIDYALGSSSAWLLTAVTVQRTMAVILPHRIITLCTKRRTRFAVALILLLAFAVQSYSLFVMEIGKLGICLLALDMEDFDAAFHWGDMLMSSFLPAVILLVCDVIMSVTLFRSAKQASSLNSSAGGGSLFAISSRSAGVSSTQNPTGHCDSRRFQGKTGTTTSSGRRETAKSLTVMLLLVSVTFLFLTLPISVIILYNKYFAPMSSHDAAKEALRHTVVTMLWYANSAVNFLLYCVSGTKIRQEFVSWITCGKMTYTQNSPGSLHALPRSRTTSLSTVSASRTSINTSS